MQDKFLVFIARHSRFLPFCLVRAVFALIAWTVWFLHLPSIRQLEKNLSRVQQSAHKPSDYKSLRRLSLAGMQSYCAYFAEAMTLPSRSASQIDASMRIAGPYVHELMRQRTMSAIPGALGHMGNWDYAALWSKNHVTPVTTVAEKLKNKDLLSTFIAIRQQLGITLFTTGDTHILHKLEEIMQEKHVLVPLLADRDLSHHGFFVSFCNSTIRVAQGPAALAYDLNLPLYVIAIYRERLKGHRRKKAGSSYGYVLDICGRIEPQSWKKLDREGALQYISQEWISCLESAIQAHPQDWHMLQPLFLEDLDQSRLH